MRQISCVKVKLDLYNYTRRIIIGYYFWRTECVGGNAKGGKRKKEKHYKMKGHRSVLQDTGLRIEVNPVYLCFSFVRVEGD